MRNEGEPEHTVRVSHRHRLAWLFASVLIIALVITGSWYWHSHRASGMSASTQTSSAQLDSADGLDSLDRQAMPSPDMSPQSQAERAVAAMSLEEQIGQLVMTTLNVGTDPASLKTHIADDHVGSVLLLGNWTGGTAQIRQVTDALQSYAPAGRQLIIATDQEGGQVQHLTGEGFSRMPAATVQGSMPLDQLKQEAATWGAALGEAGVNVNLAPVVDTVEVPRASNAPVGALNRDFGGDAQSNGEHAAAFIEGMRQANIETAIKHFPGLGAVQGNTDFTTSGISDTTTTFDQGQLTGFAVALKSQPAMVMMSLATYTQMDAHSPAAFSKAIVTDYLRQKLGFQGVVTSDSLSATAVSNTPPSELAVTFVEAGGDLACFGDADYVHPALDGLRTRVQQDQQFAQQVTQAATRVMTLKYQMGLAY